MPEVDDAIPWDFLTLVDWWNLYGLPVLLGLVTITILIRSRSRPVVMAWQAGSRIVFLVGLIHCVLALQALLFLAQELLTLRVMGIPQSFVSPVGALFGSLVNPILAIGLLRRRPWGRRLAIAWYALLSLISILVVTWLYYYRVAVDVVAWPEQLASKVLPFFLFVVMFLPRIKRVFTTRAREGSPNDQPGTQQAALSPAESPTGWPVLALLTLLFLIVVCSNLVVNAADWGYRLAFESEPLS